MADFSLNAVRFEDIRTGIVNYLKENGAYKADFDFNGSNIAYFIDTAAYLAMLMSYQNTITANNIFLDTTEIRKNAVSIVKRMGYRPKRKISSQFTGTMEYFATQGETFVSGDTVIIPARTIFISSPNSLQFMNLLPITLTFNSSVLLTGDFIIVEGQFKTVQTFGTGKELQEIVIDSEDVEENNMSVFIRSNNTATSGNIQWTEVPSFFSSTDDTIYFVEEDIVNENRPKILFGDGTLGQIPTNTETVIIEYLETLGDAANDETDIDFSGTPSGITTTAGAGSNFSYSFNNLAVKTTNLQTSSGGKTNGTLSEIQFNAPRFFSSAGRAVTKDDFLFQLSEFSATLLYFNVVGGNTLFPGNASELGKIYIVGVPTGIDESDFTTNNKIYLTELEEDTITPQIENTTVISTEKTFVKPTYVYMQLSPFIEVPATFSVAETQTSIADVSSKLDAYVVANLRGLEKSFRHSKILSTVTGSIGVVSAELDTIHNFIINDDSFYTSRESRMNLPVIFARDSSGNIILDENNAPSTSTFIKKRTEIITEENEKRIAGANESTNITCSANTSDILLSKYFTISDYTVLGTEVQYYVWFSGSGSVDPAPSGITNSLEVALSDGDTATQVATKLTTGLATINSTNAFTVSSSGADVTLVNKNAGFLINNPADGDTGFTITQTTRGLDTNHYDQFTLPISSSSLFGSLTHPNSDRKLFNIDVSSVEFITFQLIGPSGSEVLTFETFNFKDQNDVEYTPNLVESATDTWNVQMNGRTIAILNKTGATTFTLTNADDAFLSGTVGITPADGESNLLNVDSITETDENLVATAYYSLNFLLNNNVFTDIRLYGKTKIADATFDPKTFLWTWTDTPSFTSVVSGPAVTFAERTPVQVDESFLEVDHDSSIAGSPSGDKAIVLSMKNFNGAITLNNYVNDALVRYDFRNDLTLDTNYSLVREPSLVSYQMGNQSVADAGNVQQINLLAAEITQLTAQANASDILDGTFFYLNSVLDATQYYIWFSSPSGSGSDPTPIGTYSGIEVDLGGISTAADVTTAIDSAVDAVSGTPWSSALKSGETTILNITNTSNGRSTNASLPTIALSKAYAYDVTGDTFTDETTAANNTVANDMTLLPSDGAQVGDAYYFGKDHRFNTLTLNIGTAGVGTWAVEFEFWNGSAWVAPSGIVDNTIGVATAAGSFTVAGHNDVTWDTPTNWVASNLNVLSGGPNSGTFFWVRAIVTLADISGVTIPTGTQAFVSGVPRATSKAGDVVDASLFLLSIIEQGADNATTDLAKFNVDDFVVIIDSSSVNNNGTYIIKSINTSTGILEIYNNSGVSEITGTATITHWEPTGTYGTYTIWGYDIYHNITIGNLNYNTGVLIYQQQIKGYTDLANANIQTKHISNVFDNYSGTDRMDSIKIVPIDKFSNSGVFLGQENDFDSVFSQSIQTLISTPIIKIQ